MQKKLRELVGENEINTNVISNVGENIANEPNKGLNGSIIKNNQIQNMANSRVMTIKTNKYYDVNEGGIK